MLQNEVRQSTDTSCVEERSSEYDNVANQMKMPYSNQPKLISHLANMLRDNKANHGLGTTTLATDRTNWTRSKPEFHYVQAPNISEIEVNASLGNHCPNIDMLKKSSQKIFDTSVKIDEKKGQEVKSLRHRFSTENILFSLDHLDESMRGSPGTFISQMQSSRDSKRHQSKVSRFKISRLMHNQSQGASIQDFLPGFETNLSPRGGKAFATRWRPS